MINAPFFDAVAVHGVARPPLPGPDQRDEYTLLRLLEHHGQQEGEILESYRLLAERSSSGEAVQYLVKLILDDERRHHEVFAEMANEIKSFVWDMAVNPRLPSLRTHADADLLAETKRLLAFERKDAKELRSLRRTLRHSSHESLDPLVDEMMLHDTAKHNAIHEDIKARLTR